MKPLPAPLPTPQALNPGGKASVAAAAGAAPAGVVTAAWVLESWAAGSLLPAQQFRP